MKGWSNETVVFRTNGYSYVQTLDIDNHGNGALILIKNKLSVYEGERNCFFKKFINFFQHRSDQYLYAKEYFPNGFEDLINQFEENNVLILRIGSSEIAARNYTHSEIHSISYIRFEFYVDDFAFNGVVTGMKLKNSH